MVQLILFALVGFSSALVNLGVYNLALWALQLLNWLLEQYPALRQEYPEWKD